MGLTVAQKLRLPVELAAFILAYGMAWPGGPGGPPPAPVPQGPFTQTTAPAGAQPLTSGAGTSPSRGQAGGYALGGSDTFAAGKSLRVPIPPECAVCLTFGASYGGVTTVQGVYRNNTTGQARTGVASGRPFYYRGPIYEAVLVSQADANVSWELIPDGSYTPFESTLAATGTAGESVTVGLPGSGANYQSTDEKAFNSAIAQVGGAGGGIVTVWSGIYTTTLTWACVGNNITVNWCAGAIIQPANTYTNKSPAAFGGANSFSQIFVVSGTRIRIYGGPVIDSSLVAGNVATSGCVIAGNSVNVRIYDQYSNQTGRFGAWITGYINTTYNTLTSSGLALIQDGPVTDIRFVNRSSVACGNSVVPDGGGLKVSPGTSTPGTAGAACVQGWSDVAPLDRGVVFAGHDIPGGVGTVTQTIDDGHIDGGACLGTLTAGSVGVFVEQHTPGTTTATRVSNHKVYNQVTGFNIAFQSGVTVQGCQAWNCTTGFESTAIAAGSMPFIARDHIFDSCTSFSCTTGFLVNSSVGPTGSMLTSCIFNGCVADDYGAAVTTTGLNISASASNPLVNLSVSDCDFSQVTSGGVPVAFQGATAANALPGSDFSNVTGFTDQGLIATAYGTNNFEIRNSGNLATPGATAQAFRVRAPGVVMTVAAGTTQTITILSPFGSPAWMWAGGTLANGVANVTYTTSISQTLTIAVGSSSSLSINIIGPDGTVYAHNAATVTGLAVPANSTVNYGPYTGTPTTTSTISATPFSAAINQNALGNMTASGTAAAPAALVDYYQVTAGSLTVSAGSSTGLYINVIGPNGQVLLQGAATVAGLAVPAGSMVNYGPFTGTPTVTSTVGGTPFSVAYTGVATITSVSMPYNSVFTNTFAAAGATTLTSNGTAVTNPYIAVRYCSPAEGGASATASVNYEVALVNLIYNVTGGVAFAMTDQRNNAMTEVSTTAFLSRIPRGFRFTSTTIGTQKAFVDPS